MRKNKSNDFTDLNDITKRVDAEETNMDVKVKPIDGFEILVVEDNHINQVLIGVYLEQFGFKSTKVSHAEEAFEYLDKADYGLILMDIQLPNINGGEAMQIIRKRQDGKANIPIIALTANAMIGDRERYLAEGFDDYISKPINSDELYDKLFHFYDLHKTKAENK